MSDETETTDEADDTSAAFAAAIHASFTEAAQRDAAAARAWVMLLISDISWLVGVAEGGGNTVPTRITEDLQEALSFLSGGTP